MLEVEARNHVLAECLSVLEILRMLIIRFKYVCAVVVVYLSVSVGVLVVELYGDIRLISRCVAC